MSVSRRLINLAGTLVVLVALVAGTVLMALPVYLESQDLNDQERDVASSNQLLQTQIDALRMKEAEMPQIEDQLASLHTQLPGIPQLDDAVQLAIEAARKTESSIDSVEFGEVAPFSVRDQETVLASLPGTATDVRSSDAETDPAEEGGDPAATNPAPTDPATPGETPAGDLQFPVTINVKAPSVAAATRFLDELRAGPRLLQIDTVNGTSREDSEISLSITGLVFVSPTA